MTDIPSIASPQSDNFGFQSKDAFLRDPHQGGGREVIGDNLNRRQFESLSQTTAMWREKGRKTMEAGRCLDKAVLGVLGDR